MSRSGLVIGTATRPCEGQVENGDAFFVREVDGGGVFFGVIDALGHGPVAAATSALAIKHLEGVDVSRGMTAASSSLHTALRGSRGAAALLCHFKAGVLSACGVGNVEIRRFGVKLPLHLMPGVLGGMLARPPVAAVADMPVGSRVVVYSDGVSAKFVVEDAEGSADVAAANILARFGRRNDDATVLVAEHQAHPS